MSSLNSYLKHGSPTFETCVSKVHAVQLPMHLVRWKHSTTAQCLTLILSDLNDAIKKVTSGGVSNFTFSGLFLNQRLCTRANAFAQTITPPQSLIRKVESARAKSFGCYTCGKLTIRNQRYELIIETTAALQKRFWAEWKHQTCFFRRMAEFPFEFSPVLPTEYEVNPELKERQ